MFKVYRQGAVQILAGEGPLTNERVSQAREAFEQCLGKGQPRVVIDLSEIPLLDSAALEWLLDVRDHCLATSGAVHLAGPSPLCRDILQATGLASEFAIFQNVSVAVGSFAQ